MAVSILTYSAFSATVYFAEAPWQFAALWFLACLGVGGMWPNGVALVAEAWSNLSRPVAAGVIGTSANVGIFLLATLAKQVPITPKCQAATPIAAITSTNRVYLPVIRGGNCQP